MCVLPRLISAPAGILSSIHGHAGRQSGHPDPRTSPCFSVPGEAIGQPHRCQWGLPRGWDLVGYVSHLRSILIECASFELQMGRLLFMGMDLGGRSSGFMGHPRAQTFNGGCVILFLPCYQLSGQGSGSGAAFVRE